MSGLQRQRLVEIGQRFVAAAKLLPRQAALGADIGAAGRLGQQRLENGQRLGGTALLQPHHRHAM